MSTADQLLYSALHGTAMRYAADKRDFTESIAELRQLAGGRDHVLAEAAGITAGSWYSQPPPQRSPRVLQSSSQAAEEIGELLG